MMKLHTPSAMLVVAKTLCGGLRSSSCPGQVSMSQIIYARDILPEDSFEPIDVRHSSSQCTSPPRLPCYCQASIYHYLLPSVRCVGCGSKRSARNIQSVQGE